MYTCTDCYFPQISSLQIIVFGVIIHRSTSKKKELLKFKITTLNSEICDYINNHQKGYRFNAFTTAYDAQKHIESILSPEDKYMFRLKDDAEISINQWYIRDPESIDFLSRNVK